MSEFSQVRSVDPTQVPADAAILDVREPDEWDAGHISGAVHIPLMEVPARTADLPEGDVYVVCRSGGRSARAAAWLEQNGFEAINISGGMGAWQAVGREMVSETGEAPAVR
ncbi:rhodanese-like domain-containing protein [Kineosporia sp. J2-2]|uniref:Rhodanese-like domain-containing protein n=1 Tax=Kineosporia corallincola TaxID=2835133 RepID=A0ABS5TNK1_9ACTN|nr:rhodanese-like domain-containing protein [Kineosporia corallincola]MBT0771159.1 rhodanese-like domain-containing protein [Kineosporia corallincola]